MWGGNWVVRTKRSSWKHAVGHWQEWEWDRLHGCLATLWASQKKVRERLLDQGTIWRTNAEERQAKEEPQGSWRVVIHRDVGAAQSRTLELNGGLMAIPTVGRPVRHGRSPCQAWFPAFPGPRVALWLCVSRNRTHRIHASRDRLRSSPPFATKCHATKETLDLSTK